MTTTKEKDRKKKKKKEIQRLEKEKLIIEF